jgi:16S rRNA (guanine527-N7)-methyltransferase
MNEVIDVTRAGLYALGVDCSETTLLQFSDYVALLWSWNSVFRLTGERSKRELAKNQLLDSLSIHRFISPSYPLIDIGSGAGFPGIVLKILWSKKEIWLVEANRRRVNFLRDVQRSLGLKNLVVWEGRGEELEGEKSLLAYFRESTTKAFGNIEKFLEISLPVLSYEGSAVAMTGEVSSIGNRFRKGEKLSGYSNPIIHEIRLPFGHKSRTIVQFFKTSF